jgi:hypothetical protein
VAGYVGRAVVRDLLDDWRWTRRVRKAYDMAGAGGGWREREFKRRREEGEGRGILGVGRWKVKRE